MMTAAGWDFGYTAIFGGTALSTEQEIFEHALKGGAPVAVREENVGVLHVMNYYTGAVVSEVNIWLRDESYRDENYEQPGLAGKFLAFEGSLFKIHIELDENVEDTLRVIGACAYSGDVPGSALKYVVGHMNTADLNTSFKVEDAGSKSWREILMMKPVTWDNAININIDMSMHNPHAVVVA